MRFETSQSMKMGQHLRMAPRMIQSMEILQMPLAELEERLEQELEANPTLELQEGDGSLDQTEQGERTTDPQGDTPSDDQGELRVHDGGDRDDFARLDDFERDHPDAAENQFEDRPDRGIEAVGDLDGLSYRRVSDMGAGSDGPSKHEALEASPQRSASLVDQLRGQWSLADVRPRVRALGELLLQYLEDDGMLRTPLAEIADKAAIDPALGAAGWRLAQAGVVLGLRPTASELEDALRAVQLFLEPAGVAARSAEEALLLQLDALQSGEERGDWPDQTIDAARTIVRDHLRDLMQNRLPKVAEKSGLTMEQLKEALTLLKRLSLTPGRRLVETRERPIVPDAIVGWDEGTGRYYAYLNDAHLPNLRINQEYALLSKDKLLAKRDREFIKTNLGNAQWLLDAVNQRRHTLLRVVNKVVEHQREFFDFGPQALRPLPMTQVAEELGIHVATVSRAVAEKYLATPRGVMPLRKFFSGGLTTTTKAKPAQPALNGVHAPATAAGDEPSPPPQGESLAWDAIKVALRELIDGEDKRSPLSDDALASALQAKGINIARRTVAKYRDQLQVAPARLRKEY